MSQVMKGEREGEEKEYPSQDKSIPLPRPFLDSTGVSPLQTGQAYPPLLFPRQESE